MALGSSQNPVWVRRRRGNDSGGAILVVLAIALAPFAPIYVFVCKAFFIGVRTLFATTNFNNPGNENLAALAPFLGYAACLGIVIALFVLAERYANGITALYYFGFWSVIIVYGVYRWLFHVGDDPNLIFVAIGWLRQEWENVPSGHSS
jgi:hypothetical protein